jgi:hypothetical protein
MDVLCTKGKKQQFCTVKDDDGTFSQWKCTKNKNGTWSCVNVYKEVNIPLDLMNCLMRNVARLRAARGKTTAVRGRTTGGKR